MFINITPKKTENAKTDQLHALGVLETEQLHVNSNDISTVAFGEGVAQIRLSSGRRIDLEVPSEIDQLRRFVQVGSAEYQEAQKTLMERLPGYMERAFANTMEDIARAQASAVLAGEDRLERPSSPA